MASGRDGLISRETLHTAGSESWIRELDQRGGPAAAAAAKDSAVSVPRVEMHPMGDSLEPTNINFNFETQK